MAGKLTIVVGGQAGSEGKGAICARLHEDHHYTAAVRVGGPNAGHSVVDSTGFKFALRQLPVAAAVDPSTWLYIAAGSEVDPELVSDEIRLMEQHGHEVHPRLRVDREATILRPEHAEREGAIATGTTGKGIGAARADRALRKAERGAEVGFTADTQHEIRQILERGQDVMLEGTQGYVLGSHAGWYPHCTSGDCRAIDFMAMAGLPPCEPDDIIVVLRTHPIRIAGESGPLTEETSWEALGVEPEFTTVTKKQRRVGEWDWGWAERSIDANSTLTRRPRIALTFVDYWWPELAGVDTRLGAVQLTPETLSRLGEIEDRLMAEIVFLGTGPRTQINMREVVNR